MMVASPRTGYSPNMGGQVEEKIRVLELLENDPESERLIGRIEAALTELNEIAGKNGESEVKLDVADRARGA